MKKYLLLLPLLLLPLSAHAAIVFDATSTNHQVNPSSTLTFSYTVTSTANAFLTVEDYGSNGATDLVTGATWNGVSMTRAASVKVPSDRWLDLWYLTNAASGTHNIIITNSTSTFSNGQAASYAGVSAVDLFASTTKSSVTSATVSLTTTVNNDWMMLYAKSTGNGFTAATSSYGRFTSGGVGIFDTNNPITPAGSQSMAVTVNPSDNMGLIYMAFEPVVATTAAPQMTFAWINDD